METTNEIIIIDLEATCWEQDVNIPLEGTHHRGVDDAKNIAKILYTLV